MAAVIVRDYRVAIENQVFGECSVPAAVFAEAVCDNYASAWTIDLVSSNVNTQAVRCGDSLFNLGHFIPRFSLVRKMFHLRSLAAIVRLPRSHVYCHDLSQ